MFGSSRPGFKGECDPFDITESHRWYHTSIGEFAVKAGIVGTIAGGLLTFGLWRSSVMLEEGSDNLAKKGADQLEPKIAAVERSIGDRVEPAIAGVGENIEVTIQDEFYRTKEDILDALGLPSNDTETLDSTTKDCPLVLLECVEGAQE